MYIVPTIDVEGVHGTSPFEQMILGQVDDGEHGVFEIDAILRAHQVKGTFFVDVFEKSFWGEDAFRDLCRTLSLNGQDVQLHTHPGWRDDPCDFPWLRVLKSDRSYLSSRKDMMAKLSLEEQVDVLREGATMLESWTGSRPTIHRSGGYSINDDTFKALALAGFRMDSSVHFRHANSKSKPTDGQAIMKSGIFELPVTVMSYRSSIPFLSGRQKYLKTDLDTSWLSELIHYVEVGLKRNVRFMNLFMHSYSLINFDPTYRDLRYAPEKAELLNRFLHYCREHEQVEVLSCSQILDDPSHQDYLMGGANDPLDIVADRHLVHLGVQMLRNRIYERFLGNHILRQYRQRPLE